MTNKNTNPPIPTRFFPRPDLDLMANLTDEAEAAEEDFVDAQYNALRRSEVVPGSLRIVEFGGWNGEDEWTARGAVLIRRSEAEDGTAIYRVDDESNGLEAVVPRHEPALYYWTASLAEAEAARDFLAAWIH